MSKPDSPRLGEYLPYSRPTLDRDDIEAVVDVLNGTIISQGDIQIQLENAWKKLTNSRYATAFSTGSSAIHGMCFAAGIGEGDEVIVPALTFASTSNAVLHLGGTPVFADIDSATCCVDPNHVRALISDKTKAILAVDFAGRTCDYDSLRAIATDNKLLLLADAAHSAGATYNSLPVGSIADLTAFSFNPVKNITSGEGGIVTGMIPGKKSALDGFRAHGMTRAPDLLENPAPAGWYYEQQSLGFNYKLSELHAALGLSQLAKLASYNAARRRLATRYRTMLDGLPLDLPQDDQRGSHAWHLYVVRIQEAASTVRDRVFEELRSRNIGVQLHYIPVPLHPYYRRLGYSMDGLDTTADYYKRAVSLPLHPGVTEQHQDIVVECLRDILG